MSKIKILPEELVNKIAAGEVVERPASVVKELLDNSYDSKATLITVDIEEGGMKKILVVDDGEGMSKEDVELAFKSHATSKIASEDDLLNIKNYGFRGEALSSIASISKVTLRSRPPGTNLGSEIKIEGGNVISVSDTGAKTGTSVLVEDLFFNVPARKEFLKSTQAEYKAILEVVNSHALANPRVGITLIHNGKNIYNFPKDHKLEDRIREILGSDFSEKLAPVFFEHPHLEIYGFVGKPELASERRKQQYLFVNKRKIINRSLSFAIKEAYGSLIPNNTHPPYIIFIDIQTNFVDVNVHPRKEEVKFSDDRFIFNSLKNAVKKALDRTDLTPGAEQKKKVQFPSFPKPPSSFGQGPFSKPHKPTSSIGAQPMSTAGSKGFGAKPRKPFFGTPSTPSMSQKNTFSKFGGKVKPSNEKKVPSTSGFDDPFWGNTFNTEQDPFVNQSNQTDLSSKKVLQVHNLYLVTESETGITIYDQHAVHERILYEELKESYNNNKAEGTTQPLLTPVIVNLSIHETQILSEYISELEKAGFILEEFGKNSYKITQIPAIMVDKDIKAIIHELIEDLEYDEKIKEVDSKTEKMLTYLSCRTAYKAGDPITQEEAATLIDKLAQTNTKYTCPHGRPVKIEITLKELSKMFKRT